MNSRERFLATMRFQPVDRRPLWEWHYLPATIERWHGEGLPTGVNLDLPWEETFNQKTDDRPCSLAGYLGLDRGQPYCQGCAELLTVRTGMLPSYPVLILAEDEKAHPQGYLTIHAPVPGFPAARPRRFRADGQTV